MRMWRTQRIYIALVSDRACRATVGGSRRNAACPVSVLIDSAVRCRYGCDPGAGRASRRARICFSMARCALRHAVARGSGAVAQCRIGSYVIDVREMPGRSAGGPGTRDDPGQLGWEEPGEWVGGCCVHSSSLVAIATATQLVGSAQHMSLPGPSAEALQPAHAHSDPGTPYTFYPYHQHPPRPQPATATPPLRRRPAGRRSG